MFKVGSGWDIHPLSEGRALVLGGVHIESQKGCVGHSDGDALVHAVIDALLGACGLDDIGTQFPDTSAQYKDIDSMILLDRTMNMLKQCDYHVLNLDCTVVLQSPKLGPYKAIMKQKLAQALSIDDSCVCVKAKTAEHMLGELGKGDAVQAMATVLVESN